MLFWLFGTAILVALLATAALIALCWADHRQPASTLSTLPEVILICPACRCILTEQSANVHGGLTAKLVRITVVQADRVSRSKADRLLCEVG